MVLLVKMELRYRKRGIVISPKSHLWIDSTPNNSTRLDSNHLTLNQAINDAKVVLADECTTLLHGEECLVQIKETAKAVFESSKVGTQILTYSVLSFLRSFARSEKVWVRWIVFSIALSLTHPLLISNERNNFRSTRNQTTTRPHDQPDT